MVTKSPEKKDADKQTPAHAANRVLLGGGVSGGGVSGGGGIAAAQDMAKKLAKSIERAGVNGEIKEAVDTWLRSELADLRFDVAKAIFSARRTTKARSAAPKAAPAACPKAGCNGCWWQGKCRD